MAQTIGFSRLERLLLACGVIVAAVAWAAFPSWTVDDAFITYRYAENLSCCGELTWNLGEDPVEGYTGVALPVLLAVAARLGLPPEAASNAIGIAAFACGAMVLIRLLRRLDIRSSITCGIALLYVTAPIFLTHSTSGLETTLFGLGILLSLDYVQAVASESGPSGPTTRCLMFILLLTSLVRPEGVVLAVISVLVMFIRQYATSQPLLPLLRHTCLYLALPATMYFLWRYSYYGQLLPNTYYAKSAGGFSAGSFQDFGRFLIQFGFLPILAAIVAVSSRVASEWAGSRRDAYKAPPPRWMSRVYWSDRASLMVGLVFSVLVVVQYMRSALVMNYSHRFFAPLLPILLLWVGSSVESGIRHGECRIGVRMDRAMFMANAVVALFVAQIVLNGWLLPGQVKFAERYRSLLRDEHISAGVFLRQVVPADEWLVVVVDAGAIPYYSGLRTVDFGGLNDEFLSRRMHRAGLDAEIVDYFFARRPGAAVFTSSHPDRMVDDKSLQICADVRFGEYVWVATYGSSMSPDYFQLVYMRRDLVSLSPLVSARY